MPADLRLRLIGALALLVALSQLRSLWVAAAMLCLVLLLVLILQPGRAVWHRLLHVEGFVALLLIFLPFSGSGAVLLPVGPFSVREDGLIHAALVGAKITTAALVLFIAFLRVEPVRLGAALHALRVPEALVRILVLALRYLDLIRAEAARLTDAMRLRGFRAGLNRHTWRSYGNLIGMLLLRALDRAGRVDEAMRLRGFGGRFPHGVLAAPTMRDRLLFAGLCLMALTITVVDRW